MQNLIKNIPKGSRVILILLTDSGQTDGLTHCGSLYALSNDFTHLQAYSNLKKSYCGCSVAVTSTRPGGFVVIQFYVWKHPKTQPRSGSGLKRFGRWAKSLMRQSGGAGGRTQDPWVQGSVEMKLFVFMSRRLKTICTAACSRYIC